MATELYRTKWMMYNDSTTVERVRECVCMTIWTKDIIFFSFFFTTKEKRKRKIK